MVRTLGWVQPGGLPGRGPCSTDACLAAEHEAFSFTQLGIHLRASGNRHPGWGAEEGLLQRLRRLSTCTCSAHKASRSVPPRGGLGCLACPRVTTQLPCPGQTKCLPCRVTGIG